VRALQKAGFAIVRQGKHIVMSNGTRILTIPRHDPVNAFTLGGIVRDAGLTVERFRELLQEKAPPDLTRGCSTSRGEHCSAASAIHGRCA
jgi:predicted RNA binding protein YcfA (HicA-like mRNA interferase family)